MSKMQAAESPDAYVDALTDWQQARVKLLREAVRGVDPELQEAIKWGHLVYSVEGPVFLIRAEENRVLFGFWRGKRLVSLEPRLKPSGKYEMATLEFREETELDGETARRLACEAAALNRELGDPRLAAKPDK